MDIYYRPEDVSHLQVECLVMALGSLVIFGLITKRRLTWMVATLFLWCALLAFYVLNFPFGSPYSP